MRNPILYCAPIFALYLDQQFPPEESNAARRVYPNPDLRALGFEDENFDIMADENALTGSTGHNEHQLCRVNGHHPPGSFSPSRAGWFLSCVRLARRYTHRERRAYARPSSQVPVLPVLQAVPSLRETV